MTAPLVVTSGLGLRYGRHEIFRAVDLSVPPGSHTAITGRSGSGKTSLLLMLAGLVAPTAGSVTWPGLDRAAVARRAQIGLVFQAPSLMPELTALQNVVLPMRLRGVRVETADELARQALRQLAAEDLVDALPAQLSGGQQQRVAVARALAGGHRLVLADEPTGALDRVHACEVALALRSAVAATGGALVLATHDLEIAGLLDHQVVVREGTLTAVGARG